MEQKIREAFIEVYGKRGENYKHDTWDERFGVWIAAWLFASAIPPEVWERLVKMVYDHICGDHDYGNYTPLKGPELAELYAKARRGE
jgi:hypothetical protein